jgi:hypothetical protein
MDDLHGQPGSGRSFRDRTQVLLAAGSQHHLRLAVAQPGAKIGRADVRQRGGHGGVRRLRGDLAAPHAQVGPDDQGQLRLHD